MQLELLECRAPTVKDEPGGRSGATVLTMEDPGSDFSLREETAAPPQQTSESSGNVLNQLAILVPSFDPSRDDLQVYSQQVMLLLEAWPSNKYLEPIRQSFSQIDGAKKSGSPLRSKQGLQWPPRPSQVSESPWLFGRRPRLKARYYGFKDTLNPSLSPHLRLTTLSPEPVCSHP